MKKNKEFKGITLVALIVTIIILLILAGISIQTITNTGLFAKVNEAKKTSEIANIKEQIQMKIYQKELFNVGTISDMELKSILEDYGTIQYEADGTTIKGIKTSKGYEISLADINSIKTTEETLVADGSWQKGKGVNSPQLLTGMTPIKFTEPTDSEEGKTVKTISSDSEWYNYNTKKWANAQTQDGSMWVWIPRYAYRINTSTQTCDIVFLIGTTDNYYDENGELQTAKRQKTINETIDTTTGYTVHPAFTNETNIKYVNGGWNKEIAGIWVAKFEAGYATGNNTVTKADGTAYTTEEIIEKPSSVKYNHKTVWGSSIDTSTGKDGNVTARNWIDGTYDTEETFIKYPTFQGLTYSMNYININDAFNLSKALTEKDNIYGLNSNDTDSHLIKNSEWGAVTYLSKSKYGLNEANIYINNVNLNSSTTNVYAVTGCSAGKDADDSRVITTIKDLNDRTTQNVYVWTQKNGQKASTTGTIYGIYDMSGGLYENTTGLVTNGNNSLINYGNSLISQVTKTDGENITYESTPYVTVYLSNDSGIKDIDIASAENYKVNTKIYGDAIRETSTAGINNTSWYNDISLFPGYTHVFFRRGGAFWDNLKSGLLSFLRTNGSSGYYVGFRTTLVAE